MFLCAAITLQQDTILLLGFAPSLYSPYECNPLLAFVDWYEHKDLNLRPSIVLEQRTLSL